MFFFTISFILSVSIIVSAQQTHGGVDSGKLISLSNDKDSAAYSCSLADSNSTFWQRDLGDGRIVIYNGKDSSILNYAVTDGKNAWSSSNAMPELTTKLPVAKTTSLEETFAVIRRVKDSISVSSSCFDEKGSESLSDSLTIRVLQ